MQVVKSIYGDAPSAQGRPGNIFDFLLTNPYNIPSSNVAFVRASDGKTLTRADLFQSSRRLAWAFKNVLYLQAGDRVALFSPNSTTYPIVVLAALCAGITIVPLNPIYSGQEFVHPVKDAGVKYVFAHPAVAHVAREGLQLAQVPERRGDHQTLWLVDETDELARGENGEKDVRSLMGEQELQTHHVADPKDTEAFVAYSSGTSGMPKGVQLTHLNMTSVTIAIDIGVGEDFNSRDTHLAVLPMFHIFGLSKFLHHALYAGIRTVVQPKFELEQFLKAIQTYKVTCCFVVPPMLVLIAKSPVVEKYDISTLAKVLCGAAPLSAELGDEVQKRCPHIKLSQGYGLSETSPSATLIPTKDYHKYKGSAGRLLAGVEARLVTEEGKDVAHEQGTEGVPGELWLRGPTIMKGYLNRPEATADCIDKDGFFHTGDVAILKDNHFYIVDRVKELIKYKGFQVAPAELEGLLLQHPQVADAACIGVYSKAQATEFPRAYVVPKEASMWKEQEKAKAFAEEIVSWVNGKVANHKRLRGGAVIVEAVPKSPSGKILRRILRDQAQKEADAAASSSSKL
ncbi:acetyl-CoA synthetase-like protein [Ceraceosorus guamensis]|uniref:Acetyl-CoA synthetase-like protein n=1 Tax=Ceraceosorus guamensis TaxID=1522189 RepID=A0A316W937_9BASI|nr:acetyl-CoA synthetase-like protein [Ceraceosorus guamensis]PWN44225.1 acetyl-CoA synthetase-like protein [Ceraceosorus guamensis]